MSTVEPQGVDESVERQQALARRTTQAMGVALSLLFVSFLVVQRTETVLSPSESRSRASFETGTVELTDDDAGASLFAAETWAPGRRESRCIAIIYRGTHSPVDVTMRAEVTGELARSLRVAVESGSGGGFGDCSGFTPSTVLFTGSLADLGAASSQDPIALFTATRDDGSRTFRITAELPAVSDARSGDTATADISWSATPA